MDSTSKPVSENRTGDSLKFGCFRLDKEHMVLWRDCQALPLGPKVVHTLAVLVARRGEIVLKEELIREVWGDTVVDENSVAQNIYILRKTLNGDLPSSFTIETIPRRGYRFCTKAEAIGNNQNPAQSVDGKQSFEAPRHGRIRSAVLLLGALLLTGVLIYFSALGLLRKERTRRSVAVIGFVNLSRQTETAWLSPALTEMMTTELASGGKLLTVPDENVARARVELKLDGEDGFSSETLGRLWRDLGADVIVSGAYAVLASNPGVIDSPPLPANARVRLDLRVQNARTGEVLDAASITGEQSNLFELVALAGQRVRRDLGVAVPALEEAKQARATISSDPQALRFYAEGMAKLRRFEALGARELLQRSVQLDPKYALAHSALAEALDLLGYDQASIGEAKLAFELSENLSLEERMSIEGWYWEAARNRKKAVDVYRRLVDLFPDNVDYGLKLASAQIAASDTNGALSTLNLLRRLPAPISSDPRISLKEHEVWRFLGDYKRVESSLTEAAGSAQRQGALLLLAEARTRQCWVRIRLANPQQAITDCREAKQIYATVGDRRGEADALRLLGDLAAASDFQTAINYYRQALAIEQEIAHLAGQAAVINQLASLYSREGDHLAAKNSYEQALGIFRQLDAKPDSIGLLLNVGLELVALGQFDQAMKMYHEALALASKVGNKDIEALAEQNIGILQQSQGDVRAAKQSFELALMGFQEAGNTAYVAATLNFLGEVAMAEGELDAARKQLEHALSLEPPHHGLWAVSEMDLAELSLTDGRACPAEVKTSILRTRNIFRDLGSVDGEAPAATLLARCLLAEGQLNAALDTIDEATEISNKSQPDVHLSVDVIAAWIRFASRGNSAAPQALESLRRTAANARKAGYVAVELEARLAIGEIELKSGATAHGRSHLLAVEKEATTRGLLLLARKAKAAA